MTIIQHFVDFPKNNASCLTSNMLLVFCYVHSFMVLGNSAFKVSSAKCLLGFSSELYLEISMTGHALLGLLPSWGSQCTTMGLKSSSWRSIWEPDFCGGITSGEAHCIEYLHQAKLYSCVSPCQPAECQGSPRSSKRGSRLALGQIRKGKYETFVKFSEKLNSGPFMQGSQMLLEFYLSQGGNKRNTQPT